VSERGATLRSVALAAGTVALLGTALLASDWLLGRVRPEGLVYTPGAAVHYRNPEFDVRVRVNRLGFRGPELGERTPATKRILALGDSFTFGWGVEDDEAWPAVLGSRLRARGVQVDVANLGRPGASPRDYADLAESAIPQLEPDLVLIGVLQADDLLQLDEAPLATAARSPPLANLVRWFRSWTAAGAPSGADKGRAIQAEWSAQAAVILDGISPTELARLQSLDPEVQERFRTGQLNPYLVQIALEDPDHALRALEPPGGAAVETLAGELARIADAARRAGAEVWTVALPHGVYVAPSYQRGAERVGLRTDPRMLVSKAPDEAIAFASQRVGLRFLSLLAGFRARPESEQLFHPLDGHPTPAGQRLIADGLEAPVADWLAGEDRSSGAALAEPGS
jgi:hypothetical protein